MNTKFILSILTVLCLQLSLFGQDNKGKAEKGKDIVCKINGNKVELIDSKVKIADLTDANVQLFCNGKGVKILKHEIKFSSKDLNKMGELIGEGIPLDMSDYEKVGDDKDKDLHPGAMVLITLTYIVVFDTGDVEKSTRWMIELE